MEGSERFIIESVVDVLDDDDDDGVSEKCYRLFLRLFAILGSNLVAILSKHVEAVNGRFFIKSDIAPYVKAELLSIFDQNEVSEEEAPS